MSAVASFTRELTSRKIAGRLARGHGGDHPLRRDFENRPQIGKTRNGNLRLGWDVGERPQSLRQSRPVYRDHSQRDAPLLFQYLNYNFQFWRHPSRRNPKIHAPFRQRGDAGVSLSKRPAAFRSRGAARFLRHCSTGRSDYAVIQVAFRLRPNNSKERGKNRARVSCSFFGRKFK
jgi:hypothetical protein